MCLLVFRFQVGMRRPGFFLLLDRSLQWWACFRLECVPGRGNHLLKTPGRKRRFLLWFRLRKTYQVAASIRLWDVYDCSMLFWGYVYLGVSKHLNMIPNHLCQEWLLSKDNHNHCHSNHSIQNVFFFKICASCFFFFNQNHPKNSRWNSAISINSSCARSTN